MSGEIDISKLSGTVQAFAKAADRNSDGKIDIDEASVFYGYLNGTDDYNNDNALLNEFTKQASDSIYPNNDKKGAGYVSFDSPEEKDKTEKDNDKYYQEMFGDYAIFVQETEEGVDGEVMKKCAGLQGTEFAHDLDELIASRPKLNDFKGDANGYTIALNVWAQNIHDKFNEIHLPETSFEIEG